MRNVAARFATAGLLALAGVGCTRMSDLSKPADFVAAKKPTRIWVTGSDNSVVVVSHPSMRGDTLAGFANNKYFEMPMADVKQIRASVPAGGHTLLLAGAGAAVMGAILVQMRGSHATCQPSSLPPGEDELTAC